MEHSEKIFSEFMEKHPGLAECFADIRGAYEFISACYSNGGKLLVCGNGGSAADSLHIVGELMKGFNLRRELPEKAKKPFDKIEGGRYIADSLQGALPAISLVSEASLISAFANDVNPSLIFAQQVYGYAKKPHDVLLALSTSGNAPNVINAAKTARAVGIKTVSITGEIGGVLEKYSDVCVKVPAAATYEAQELTLPVYHVLCAMVEAHFYS